MIYRISAFPIYCALVLSLLGISIFQVFGQAATSNSSTQPVRMRPDQAPEQVGPKSVVATGQTAPLVTTTAVAKATSTYTVVKGDSWSSIAQKFKTSRKKLKDLNHTSVSIVKPGQILIVPALKSSSPASASSNREKTPHSYLAAQPVQDFDIPASTFGSCPVPLTTPEDDIDKPSTEIATSAKSAPIAKLVSPDEMKKELSPCGPNSTHSIVTTLKPIAPLVPNSGKPTTVSNPLVDVKPPSFSALRQNSNPANLPSQNPHLSNRISSPNLASNPQPALAASDWGNRFLQQARLLGARGIEYDDEWRPPGESHSWVMDCSNTARYLYKITAGIQLPRTASDQYYYLHLQGKAWDVPQRSNGFVDLDYLQSHLKPGDLLFWENTYRPERQPPITHVMVFVGTNAQGQWLMAGSQSSRGGEHNRRNGGPDVYVFRPSQPSGGYTTWMGLVHHKGRFCAFGRPLEADPAKLSVAADN